MTIRIYSLFSKHISNYCFITINKNSSYENLLVDLNDTQREIQDLARKFCKEEIIPVAAEYDQKGEYPHEIVKKAWALGFPNGHIPAHCGKYKFSVQYNCCLTHIYLNCRWNGTECL